MKSRRRRRRTVYIPRALIIIIICSSRRSQGRRRCRWTDRPTDGGDGCVRSIRFCSDTLRGYVVEGTLSPTTATSARAGLFTAHNYLPHDPCSACPRVSNYVTGGFSAGSQARRKYYCSNFPLPPELQRDSSAVFRTFQTEYKIKTDPPPPNPPPGKWGVLDALFSIGKT